MKLLVAGDLRAEVAVDRLYPHFSALKWTARDGRQFFLWEMSCKHLHAVIQMLIRKKRFDLAVKENNRQVLTPGERAELLLCGGARGELFHFFQNMLYEQQYRQDNRSHVLPCGIACPSPSSPSPSSVPLSSLLHSTERTGFGKSGSTR